MNHKGCLCDSPKINTKEYVYKQEGGGGVVIQYHSVGHNFGDGGPGDQGAHFNY